MAGLFTLLKMRREMFPQFSLDMIVVSVSYPGSSPEEVEAAARQAYADLSVSRTVQEETVQSALAGLSIDATATANFEATLESFITPTLAPVEEGLATATEESPQ